MPCVIQPRRNTAAQRSNRGSQYHRRPGMLHGPKIRRLREEIMAGAANSHSARAPRRSASPPTSGPRHALRILDSHTSFRPEGLSLCAEQPATAPASSEHPVSRCSQDNVAPAMFLISVPNRRVLEPRSPIELIPPGVPAKSRHRGSHGRKGSPVSPCDRNGR